MSQVWTEKYRPKDPKEIIGQHGVVTHLLSLRNEMGYDGAQYIDSSHLLFTGPPGVGKTATARAFADAKNIPIHIFNASSKATRGIEFVENEVSPLARNGIGCVILLDEADQITKSAQMALKGVLENCSCLFILTCNNPEGIIEPLKSRCVSWQFNPIDGDDALEVLDKITTLEQVEMDSWVLENIVSLHDGDLRAMINALQSVVSVQREKGEQEGLKFMESMGIGFNVIKYLALVCDHELESAFTMLRKQGDIRSVLKQIMMVSFGAKIMHATLLPMVTHIVTAYRDLQFGMPEEVVAANFTRLMHTVPELYDTKFRIKSHLEERM
tara:strand:+ start:571 stop:1551 length:981 start_codon:yes stop_codon:yes gene_type:complete